MALRPAPFLAQDQAKLEIIQQLKRQFDALSEASKTLISGFPEMRDLLKGQKGSLSFDNESLPLYADALDKILSNEWFKKYQHKELDEWLELQNLKVCPSDPRMAQDETGKKEPIPEYLRKELDNLLIQMCGKLAMALEISKKNKESAMQTALSQPTPKKGNLEDQEAIDEGKEE